MDEFIVSARKYRPKTFDRVVGQENITQTLLKAIENNHLGQAFLFNGPRGVGKTTCARILAREVNRFHADESEDNQEYSFNIFELDAASNNGVDGIRNLIDQVRIPPQIGSYKVYIIDEVHMLSTSAFNAFLKTLEEPPPYAIFILATTEKHKILPTVISRCQVFDFQRITIAQMVAHLKTIAQKEGVTIDGDALHVIAEKADGALRDALSIFDQMVSFAGKTVTYRDVIENLNILDYDYYFELCDAFSEGDTRSVLVTFNRILQKGFDGHNFIVGLANHVRNVLMCLSPKTAEILEVGESVKARYIKQSEKLATPDLVKALELLGKADLDYGVSRNQRLLVEIVLLRLCSVFGEAEKKSADSPEKVPLAPPSPPKTEATEPNREVASPENSNGPEEKKPAAENDPISKVAVAPTEDSGATPTTSDPSNSDPEDKTEKKPTPSPFNAKLKRAQGIPSLKKMQTPTGKTGAGEARAEEPTAAFDDKPAEPFNLAELWRAWDAYAQRIKNADKQSYYATLTKRKPVMREDNLIELLVDNHVQLTDLEADRSNLLEFIRERLNNWKIQLRGVIDEDEDNHGDSLYDPVKRFAVMAEKNPDLKKMKERFDLDIDYDG